MNFDSILSLQHIFSMLTPTNSFAMLNLFCISVKRELAIPFSLCASLFCALHFMALFWCGVKKLGRVQRAWARPPQSHIISWRCRSQQVWKSAWQSGGLRMDSSYVKLIVSFYFTNIKICVVLLTKCDYYYRRLPKFVIDFCNKLYLNFCDSLFLFVKLNFFSQ